MLHHCCYRRLRRCGVLTAVGFAACGSSTDVPVEVTAAGPAVAAVSATQGATVSTPFSYDATLGGTAFSDPKRRGLSYTVVFTPTANGLTASAGRISGTPLAPAVLTARLIATDSRGDTASQSFAIVTFAAGLSTPTLPSQLFGYSDASMPLPLQFIGPGPGGSVIGTDNSLGNPATDAGATLGRVLFYDRRLSANDRVSCGSCHIQSAGFSDTAKLSVGFLGGRTTRHAMSLANARFYQRGRFFWDERAATLEAQVLQPIQNEVEMGMTLQNLTLKVGATPYYPALFLAAFGSSDVTTDRIARALSQYVRSLVSGGSRFDESFAAAPPTFANLTAQEQEGQQLFVSAGCAACHATNAVISDDVHNTGLDATVTDVGAGNGRFKSPSLRNVAIRAPYMHDGRFATLQQVIAFYDNGVQNNPNLDGRLRVPGGGVRRLNLSQTQRNALVAFLGTLTDPSFLTSPRFSDPFR